MRVSFYFDKTTYCMNTQQNFLFVFFSIRGAIAVMGAICIWTFLADGGEKR